MNNPDTPGSQKNVLVIMAHPDDPEFFCGGTLAHWATLGHTINYLILTGGEKGGNTSASPEELVKIRHDEQIEAGKVIGVNFISFLDLPDGMLVPSIDLRCVIARQIRKTKPDVIVTSDPSLFFTRSNTINHPDHRAAGQIVLESVFPAAGNKHFFPELLREGFLPHTPEEVWITLPVHPTYIADITDFWEIKMTAIKKHRSQINNVEALEEKMRSRRAQDSSEDNPRYEEYFHILRLK